MQNGQRNLNILNKAAVIFLSCTAVNYKIKEWYFLCKYNFKRIEYEIVAVVSVVSDYKEK